MKNVFWGIGLVVMVGVWGCEESGEIPINSDFVVSSSELSVNTQKIGDKLLPYVDKACGEELEVIIGFNDFVSAPIEEFSLMNIDGSIYLDGKLASSEDLKKFDEDRAREIDETIQMIGERRKEIIDEIKQYNYLKDDSGIEKYINGFETLKTKIDVCDIKKIIALNDVRYIDIPPHISNDTIETAMLATYVTQSAGYTYNHQGQNIGIYTTDKDCPPASYFNNSNYTILTGTVIGTDEHGRMTTRVLRDVSPNAHIYCRPGYSLPETTDLGTNHNPPITIASLSYGYNSDTYAYDDKVADNLMYGNILTIVKSAGNSCSDCTCPTGRVNTPGKGLNVITVGNYNDYNNTPSLYEINGESCYINPSDTKNSKPEVSAPGVNITGATNSNGVPYDPYSGTSFSAPHVAGMLANYATKWANPVQNYDAFKGSLFKLRLLMGAKDEVMGGYEKVGVGGADFYRVYNFHMHWQIYASSFNSFISSHPSQSENGMIVYKRTYSASTTSKGRVGIAWLTRGEYTYDHKNDPYPIGSTYALTVFDPNGDVVATGWNPYDNFVILDFNHRIAGEYTLAIHKIAERDTDATMKLFMSVE